MYRSWLPVCLSVAAQASAQTSSTSSTPEVPTGTPIPGDYTGQYRPQVHFSAPEFFINDPNGMFVDDNGTWHLYYQYNPTDYVAGNQHWGHATSKDLYHWENQPIALFPPEENTFVFSGSAVKDPNNTSGFFPDQTDGVVAIYVSCPRFSHSGAFIDYNRHSQRYLLRVRDRRHKPSPTPAMADTLSPPMRAIRSSPANHLISVTPKSFGTRTTGPWLWLIRKTSLSVSSHRRI